MYITLQHMTAQDKYISVVPLILGNAQISRMPVSTYSPVKVSSSGSSTAVDVTTTTALMLVDP